MRSSSLPLLICFGALAVVSASCSQLPTAPNVDATLARDGSIAEIIRTGDPEAPTGGRSGAIGSITLVPGEGGTLQAGNFTVIFHKNSLQEGATVRVIQPDPDVMEVEFEVTPESANDFKVPVKIIADCSKDSPEAFQNETMYEWDGQWQEATSVSVDATALSLTTHVRQLRKGRVAPRGQGVSNKVRN